MAPWSKMSLIDLGIFILQVYCHGEHHEQTECLLAYLQEPESHPANGAALRNGCLPLSATVSLPCSIMLLPAAEVVGSFI